MERIFELFKTKKCWRCGERFEKKDMTTCVSRRVCKKCRVIMELHLRFFLLKAFTT